MKHQFAIKQSSPTFWKRIRFFVSRLFGTRLQKDKSLHVVSVNGQRFKRLILCDSYLTAELERYLEKFEGSGYFPPLVARYERELWLEYIEGHKVKNVDESLVKQVAEFYGTLYKVESTLVETSQTSYPDHLLQDLRFLSQVGVLSSSDLRDLQGGIPTMTPKQVWIGYEYTDPVLKNFILLPETGRLCVVDVDGLTNNQLLGIGIAKACVRWLSPHQRLFFSHLSQQGSPDFHSYFDFVELCFLARWTKRAFFEQDWDVIQPSLFARFKRTT